VLQQFTVSVFSGQTTWMAIDSRHKKKSRSNARKKA
jgi:hypothetical protein